MYYPRPPYSTINFLIVGDTIDPVVEAQFFHQDIAETGETYPIKTADQAFEELRNGKGYIASFFGTSTTVKIKDVTLGYYISDRPQEYLMPIIVFHGDNDFIAYVSAVQNTWIK